MDSINKTRYAFFDFDGTLIAKDSFVTLLRIGLKNEPWRVLIILFFIPLLLATAIFKFDKTPAKSAILWSLTVGKGKKRIISFFRTALTETCHKIWFEEAIETFQKLKNDGIEIIIITASGQIWVRAMLSSKYKDFKLIIGSKLCFFFGGVILSSKNCYGKEKLLRIKQILGNDFIWQSAWSDHIADLPLLMEAKEKHIICPKKSHKLIFDNILSKDYILHLWKTSQ